MCSFFQRLFTVTGNNYVVHNKIRIGNRKSHSKLPIIAFQITSISLIESEEFREISNDLFTENLGYVHVSVAWFQIHLCAMALN